jgi:hypothetical protein
VGTELQQQAVQQWIEKVVIGLNLCPFAGREWQRGRVRCRVSDATSEPVLLDHLRSELQRLEGDPDIETTVLVHPDVLSDFFDYNQFLEEVDRLLSLLDLDGIFQVASFHPDYLFAGTSPEDVTNYTNRSPYPILHLLREESLSIAIENHPDPEGIPARNMALLESMGLEKVQALLHACSEP